jgi:transcription initiation factor TFIIIB Brf1 subunit/transcription initiation factor TFIIB
MDLKNIKNMDNVQNLNEDDLFELLDHIDYINNLNRLDDKFNNKIDDICDDTVSTDETNNLDNLNFCDNCNTIDFIVNDLTQGIAVCTGCGNIMNDIIDKNPEWKTYDNNGKNTVGRCSMPTNHFLPQSSLGTSIACSSRSKIKTLHGWSAMPYKERSLYNVLKEIQHRCRSANILKCIEDDAKILYKNISECTHLKGDNKGKSIIIRGKNRRSLIAACVFFACKRKGHTRSPWEIAGIFDLKETDITKGCKTFLKLIKIRRMAYDFNSSTPEHFVTRFCKILRMQKEYILQTVKIIKNIQKLNIASVHTPLSIATGCILLVVNINGIQITKKMMANKFGVSEVTINKAYRELEQYKKIIIDDELTDKLAKAIEEERIKMTIPKFLIDRYNKINTTNNINDCENQNNTISSECEVFEIKEITVNSILSERCLDKYFSMKSANIYDKLYATNSEYLNIISKMKT